MPKKKKIRNPWCLYCHGTPSGVGKVVEESKNSAEVVYFENCRDRKQPYSSGHWDKKSLRRFATITAAIKEYGKWSDCSLDELKEIMSGKFPSQRKVILKIKG